MLLLYLREKRLHRPDDHRLKRFTDSGYVVLSGGYQAGSISPSIRRSEEHRLAWGGGFTDWFEGGTVDTVDEAREAHGRRRMLTKKTAPRGGAVN